MKKTATILGVVLILVIVAGGVYKWYSEDQYSKFMASVEDAYLKVNDASVTADKVNQDAAKALINVNFSDPNFSPDVAHGAAAALRNDLGKLNSAFIKQNQAVDALISGNKEQQSKILWLSSEQRTELDKLNLAVTTIMDQEKTQNQKAPAQKAALAQLAQWIDDIATLQDATKGQTDPNVILTKMAAFKKYASTPELADDGLIKQNFPNAYAVFHGTNVALGQAYNTYLYATQKNIAQFQSSYSQFATAVNESLNDSVIKKMFTDFQTPKVDYEQSIAATSSFLGAVDYYNSSHNQSGLFAKKVVLSRRGNIASLLSDSIGEYDLGGTPIKPDESLSAIVDKLKAAGYLKSANFNLSDFTLTHDDHFLYLKYTDEHTGLSVTRIISP